MKETLTQTLSQFAQFRELERQLTGQHHSEIHRLFAVLKNGETKEVGHHGDAYEMLQTFAVRLMLDKVKELRDIDALIIETQAMVAKADATGNEPDPDTEPLDVVVSTIHNGEEIACYVSPVHPEQAEAVGFTAGLQDGEGHGKLAEALEKMTLAVFMAQHIAEAGETE
jgi:hypothetical protein